MADRGDTNHGFHKFLNDPKTSVIGYIAENIPTDRLSGAAQGCRPPVSPRPQYADMQQANSQNENQAGNLVYQSQQEYAQSGNGGLGYGLKARRMARRPFFSLLRSQNNRRVRGIWLRIWDSIKLIIGTGYPKQKAPAGRLISTWVYFNRFRILDRACRRMVIRRTVKNWVI